MTPRERAEVRARALHLLRNPKPRRLVVAAMAFVAGLLVGTCA